MADGIFKSAFRKLGHIAAETFSIAGKGLLIGATIGVVAAAATFLIMGGGLPALAGFGALKFAGALTLGTAVGASTGLGTGAAVGWLKGVFTRPRPNGEQIMADALNKEPQGMGQGLAPAPGLAPTVPYQHIGAAEPQAARGGYAPVAHPAIQQPTDARWQQYVENRSPVASAMNKG